MHLLQQPVSDGGSVVLNQQHSQPRDMSSFESDIKRAVGEPNIDTCEIAGAVVVAAGRSGASSSD